MNPTSGYRHRGNPANTWKWVQSRVRSCVGVDSHNFRTLRESDRLFALFCSYLSTRVDLLCLEERQLLAVIPDCGKPLPFEKVADYVAVQLGFSLDRIFHQVSPYPLESRILYNTYGAVIAGGEKVCITVLRPGIAEIIHAGLSNLRVQAARVFPKSWQDCLSIEVVGDFYCELTTHLDLLSVAENAESLYHVAQTRARLWAPKVYRDICRPGLLITQRQDGLRLSQIAEIVTGPGRGSISDRGAERLAPGEVAKSLLQEWLQLALSAGLIATRQELSDLVVLEDGRVGWVGGTFAAIPQNARERIWCYVAAAAADDPDESCLELGQLMQPGGAASEQDLISSFRQIATFRHLEDDALQSELTLLILRQLQVMLSHGYRPDTALVQFYRGLFSMLALARRIYPCIDPLPEAVEETWVAVVFEPIRQASRADALAATLIKCAASMLALPGEVDRYLDVQLGVHSETASGPVRQFPAHRLLPVLLIAIAILILGEGPAHYLPHYLSGRTTDFALGCVVGGLLLYLVRRD